MRVHVKIARTAQHLALEILGFMRGGTHNVKVVGVPPFHKNPRMIILKIEGSKDRT
jgi:hypothetical protein